MKIYNNELTKKILTGLTTIVLMTSSYSSAHAIENTISKIPQSSPSTQVNTLKNGEITYEEFNKFYELVKNDISVLKDLDVLFSDIDLHKHSIYNPDYNIGLKVLIYFANYDYISNTKLEEILRKERIVDTYISTNFFGLDLDLCAANSILTDFSIYNHKTFDDIKYDEEESILSRKINVQNISQLLNPSLFLMNKNDRKFVDLQFNKLIELIHYCGANDKKGIEECLNKYFNIDLNYPDITNGARWLNNLTNNAMCIKIIETYLIQNYDKDLLEQFFNSLLFSNLYFKDYFIEDDERYDVEKINFSSISDSYLRSLLEYDRLAHTKVYCNPNNELFESIEKGINKNLSKSNSK